MKFQGSKDTHRRYNQTRICVLDNAIGKRALDRRSDIGLVVSLGTVVPN